ncbi:protein TolR [Crenothrix polyspora]|nr:protein TolR [Crenothrix polyspora]
MAEINVVPYIDVTLVLLIIFMITTPMLQTGVEVELPRAQAASVDSGEGEPPLVVSIKKSGEFYISVGGNTDELIPQEEIDTRVAAVLAEKPTVQVLINADKSIDYGTVVTVMASLKNAGVANVGLMTKSDDQ